MSDGTHPQPATGFAPEPFLICWRLLRSFFASAHVCTAQFAQVIRLLRTGDMALARQLWTPLVAVISAMFSEPNPASIKNALAQQGWIANSLRLPMQSAKKPFDLAFLSGTVAGQAI